MVWLGFTTVLRPATPYAHATASGATESWGRQAVRGFGTSGLNPKVLLLFLALLPQFTDPTTGWPVAAQILLLGLVHLTSCAVVYTGVGTGARAVLRARPAAARIVSRVSGAVMITLGVALTVEQLI
ncbi:LysE family transporter [Pseudonocardia sp. RS11V-5]|uniref:LysE family translocator n=1 Tax=Pseudonocardia terrae TaxID=2905831 RepID=UPI001E47ACAA|nr:LysE family transporter [Pseudonocardia terrae]MCE3554363.1 LysE family transporter [Pseudonocardia terrae]